MKKIIALVATSLMLVSASAFAAPKKKSPQKEAKRQCLAENPELSGKALQRCIKRKRK